VVALEMQAANDEVLLLASLRDERSRDPYPEYHRQPRA
jgi:hypothetical protein